MIKFCWFALFLCFCSAQAWGQVQLEKVRNKKYKTEEDVTLQGSTGYMVVPENRQGPNSRSIRVKYVHLKSIAKEPLAPVVYIEGGGGYSTWQVESPFDLTFWLEILEVSDLVFIDRRGSTDDDLGYLSEEGVPNDLFLSEKIANAHFQRMAKTALPAFEKKGIDLKGYTITEQAQDVHDLMDALQIERYSLFGFSFGTQISMALMEMHPEHIDRVILAGADGLDQALNYPHGLDQHMQMISELIAQDSVMGPQMPDFLGEVEKAMTKLEKEPARVTVKNPLTRKDQELQVGPFGLALILRLDIDDANDIPIMPRLLHTINAGDYTLLQWFVQKRMIQAIGIPGQGINQQLATGASAKRWFTILEQAQESPYGNVVNFPFSALYDHWLENELPINTDKGLQTEIPTLFITGMLDCRTSVEQVEEIRKGFSQSVHLRVKGAGHEQAMWEDEAFDQYIPAFLQGQTLEDAETLYWPTTFIPLEGPSDRHPALKK